MPDGSADRQLAPRAQSEEQLHTKLLVATGQGTLAFKGIKTKTSASDSYLGCRRYMLPSVAFHSRVSLNAYLVLRCGGGLCIAGLDLHIKVSG